MTKDKRLWAKQSMIDAFFSEMSKYAEEVSDEVQAEIFISSVAIGFFREFGGNYSNSTDKAIHALMGAANRLLDNKEKFDDEQIDPMYKPVPRKGNEGHK